jgi:hypothetical protein
MHLHLVDWFIIPGTLLICFVPALFFGKRTGKNTSAFFASGRSVPCVLWDNKGVTPNPAKPAEKVEA